MTMTPKKSLVMEMWVNRIMSPQIENDLFVHVNIDIPAGGWVIYGDKNIEIPRRGEPHYVTPNRKRLFCSRKY